MPSRSLAVAVLAACLVAGGCAKLRRKLLGRGPAPNPDDCVLDIYYQRALKGHTGPTSACPDPAAAFGVSHAATNYTAIHPERSVFLWRCWSGAAPCWRDQHSLGWTFDVIRRMAASGSVAQSLADGALAELARLDNTLATDLWVSPLTNSNLQLLAVANRMDMAHLEGTNWVGAEMHFVYGKQPVDSHGDVAHLSMVVEYELGPIPIDAFRDLASRWARLSRVPDSEYLGELDQALAAAGLPVPHLRPPAGWPAQRVKIRTNHEIVPTQWRLAQVWLKAGDTAFSARALDDQFPADFDLSPPAVCKEWITAAAAVQTGPFAYHSAFQTSDASVLYQFPAKGLGIPPSCSVGESMRYLFSSQECAMCHTIETANRVETGRPRQGFMHVSNRPRQGDSVLSGFLIGNDAGGADIHPDLIDLYNPNPKRVWSASVPYDGPRSPAGRSFHDVARRTLFLAEIEAGLNRSGKFLLRIQRGLSTFGVE